MNDLASAVVHLMLRREGKKVVKVGRGGDITIRNFVGLVARVLGYEDRIGLGAAVPGSAPRKLPDRARVTAFGWWPCTWLEDVERETHLWFIQGAYRSRGQAS